MAVCVGFKHAERRLIVKKHSLNVYNLGSTLTLNIAFQGPCHPHERLPHDQ